MAKPKRDQKIDNEEINRPPGYLDSVSDIPYQVRTTSAIDIADNVFRIQKTVPFELSFASTPGGVAAGVKVIHGLGYRPFVQGYYFVTESDSSNFPVEQRGLIPEYRQLGIPFFGIPNSWEVWIDDVNEFELTLNVSGTQDGSWSGSIEGDLLLFKELSI